MDVRVAVVGVAEGTMVGVADSVACSDRVTVGVGDVGARAVGEAAANVAVGDGVRVGNGVPVGRGVSVAVDVGVGGGVDVAGWHTSAKRMEGGSGASLGVPMPHTHPTTAPGLTA